MFSPWYSILFVSSVTSHGLSTGFNNLRRVDWGGLGAASCLAVLDVSSNKLTTVEDSVFALQRLHTLDISNNDIGGT